MISNKLSVVCFISGRGSNLNALISSAEHYEILSVISNKPSAAGLTLAQEASIPTHAVSRKSASSLLEQKNQLYSIAKNYKPDLILLAGYMQIIEVDFIAEFANKIINIHPSLLPAFPGLDTHKRALSKNAIMHGCSVHVVEAEVDSGPIIAQAECSIAPEETEETLAAKVLKHEHQLYPWVINNIALGEITIKSSGAIQYSKKVLQEASNKRFKLAQ